MTLTLSFDAAVNVDTSGGTPTLLLETGSADRAASYVSGSGSSTLSFSYTVQSGDQTADLDYASTAALSLNGATIRDAGNVDAILTLPAVGGAGSIAGQKALVVDGVRPTASIVVAEIALAPGDTSLVTITFSEAVSGFSNADLTVANGALSAVSSSDGGITWTATFTPTASVTDSTNLITLNNAGVQDAAGNAGSGSTDSNSYAIDTARPTASIVFADSTLGIGETSLVTITFSESVSGFSNADLTVSNGVLSAVNSSDGGITWTATFAPTAAISASTNVITLDNTGVQDAFGNAGAGTTSSANYLIDGIAPVITSVTVPTDGTYKTGQNLDFTVNLTEAVTVDTTDGTPSIAISLDTGGTVRANYVSGSGSAALVFRMTVASGQIDKTGITTGGSIDANGGTLRDAAGNDLALSLNGTGSTTGVLVEAVDTVPPPIMPPPVVIVQPPPPPVVPPPPHRLS